VRTIEMPTPADPERMTTAVVIDPDGTVRHVPTKLIEKDGKRSAAIYSRTNSLYGVIWNPVSFADMEGHWAEAVVHDMGARMVVSGVGNGRFRPDDAVTRAEFTAILVKALGLRPKDSSGSFEDVMQTDWYNGYIETALEHGLVSGLEDGRFRPADRITREQAAAIIANAIALTGMECRLAHRGEAGLLSGYSDADELSHWAVQSAAANLEAGIMTGRSVSQLAPRAELSRAEAAVIAERLLRRSEFIE